MKISRFLLITLSLFVSVFGISAQETENKTQIAKIISTENKSKTAENKAASAETEKNASSSFSVGIKFERVGVQTADTLPLTINEAIRRALENNNSIEVARQDVKIAESTLRSLLGVYDPVFTLNPRYTKNIQPQTTTLGGADTSGTTRSTEYRFDSSYNHPVKQGGGNVNVFFNNSRNSSSSSFVQLNPTYNTNLGVSFTQPLFRNRKIDRNRQQIKIQKKRISQSDADFRRQTIETISQVQQAYWNLVFALRDQQNKVLNLNLSKENLRQVDVKIDAGASAPLERAEVATELANRESDVLVATQQVSIAENSLKQLFLRDQTAAEWNLQIVPTDNPVFSTETIDLSLAIKDAVENRPELTRLKLQKEINDIDLQFLKNQVKPQIDLETSYTMIGLSGNGSGTTIPPQFIGGYGQSLRNLFGNDTRNFTVGVTISFPLKNKTAKANLATAEYQKTQIEAQTRSQEQTVIVEVRNAVQAVETARQRVLTARRARENAEKQLEGERQLYEVGRSTTFLLFQRENALANARNSEIRSETDYNKALSDLQKATSTTFRANNIDIESPMDDK